MKLYYCIKTILLLLLISGGTYAIDSANVSNETQNNQPSINSVDGQSYMDNASMPSSTDTNSNQIPTDSTPQSVNHDDDSKNILKSDPGNHTETNTK